MNDQDPVLRFDIPHSARIWNYWLGGKDNYAVDQAVGDMGIAICPEITTMARQGRQFLVRTVRYLAGEAGIRQFLDIGTGLPTMQNTHEVAQSVTPDARVVYVDNDPLVLVHARALLTNTTPEGVTAYIDADFHEPEKIIAASREILNFDEPIAVMFIGVLGHARSYAETKRIIATLMDAVPSGSYLSLLDGSTDSESYVRLCEEYAKSGGVPYIPRSPEELRGGFEGLELVEPGFVSVTLWRPDRVDVGEIEAISGWGGVARKP